MVGAGSRLGLDGVRFERVQGFVFWGFLCMWSSFGIYINVCVCIHTYVRTYIHMDRQACTLYMN